jgi:hypothetical protein
MLRYVHGHDEAVAQFVSRLVPHGRGRSFGPIKATGVLLADGSLIAGVVYGNWNDRAGTIEIAAAATNPRWLTRRTIEVIYDFPFRHLGCQMIVQHTPADDERLLHQLAVGGYKLILFPRLYGRERDGVICTLTRETWEGSRFIRRRRDQMERAA